MIYEARSTRVVRCDTLAHLNAGRGPATAERTRVGNAAQIMRATTCLFSGYRKKKQWKETVCLQRKSAAPECLAEFYARARARASDLDFSRASCSLEYPSTNFISVSCIPFPSLLGKYLANFSRRGALVSRRSANGGECVNWVIKGMHVACVLVCVWNILELQSIVPN